MIKYLFGKWYCNYFVIIFYTEERLRWRSHSQQNKLHIWQQTTGRRGRGHFWAIKTLYNSMYVVFILGIINVTMMRNWGGKNGYSWRSCKKPQDFNHPDLFSNFCNNQKIGTMSNFPSPKSAIEIRVTAHLALVHWDQEECVWATAYILLQYPRQLMNANHFFARSKFITKFRKASR